MKASGDPSGRARVDGTVLTRPLVLISLVVGSLFSAGLFALARTLNQREDQRRLERDGRECISALRFGIEEHLNTLEALRSLWMSSKDVGREDFRTFVRPLLARYPALQALEWAPVVRHDQVSELIRSAAADGIEDFRVRSVEGSWSFAEPRTLLYPVFYLEPLESNEQALGLDLGSERLRRAALEGATAANAMRATEPVQLVQGAGALGLVVVLPVVLDAASRATPELVPGRDGFAVAVLRLDKAIRTALGRLQDSGLDLRIVIRGGAGRAHTLWVPAQGPVSTGDPGSQLQPASSPIEFDLAGSTWQVSWRPGQTYQHGGFPLLPWMLLGIGLLLTAALTSMLVQRELRAVSLERANLELAAASSALQASEERFRLLFERHGTTMILVDGETSDIVDANPAAARFYGYSREKLRRMRVSDLNTLPSSRIRDLLDEAAEESRDFFVVPHRLASGEERLVEIHSSPIEYQGRRLLFSIVHDISEREAMQRKLLATQKLESLGVLAGGIAHDFNNLLTSVMGNAELARQQIGPDSPAHRHLDLCLSALGRAADLTGRLLDYAGKGGYGRQRIDLAEQVREVVELLRPGVPPGVQIELDLQADMPALTVDRSQLHQVLMNLLLNAVEACDPAQGRVLVRTARVDQVPALADAPQPHARDALGPHALIEVRDDGAGMDAATLARIFDPFFSTKFPGRGLGLAAVQGIVRSHQGLLAVDSRPGHGACFRVWLPLELSPALPAVRDRARGSVARLLVVDDDPTVREVTASMLETLGFEAAVAESGERALELVGERGQDFDLVIIDVNMPGLDGEATLRLLRERKPGLPVLLTSGYDEHEAQRRRGSGDSVGFLQKPYSPRVLAEKVRSLLAGGHGASAPGGSG